LILAFGVYFGSAVAFIFMSLFISIVMTALFGTGAGLLLAVSAHRIRDIKMAIPLGLQLWFFLTPIIYPMSLAPEWATVFYWLNPLAVSIETMRRFAFDGSWDPVFVAVGMITATAIFALGSLVFIKTFERAFDS
jgi:ABC-type polysaccharide/polyol phosphate export permease